MKKEIDEGFMRAAGRVHCEIEGVSLAGDYGNSVDGILVTCTKCQHELEAYGEQGRSVRYALATMREECPRKRRNRYYIDSEEF